jgi:Tfp pilus assembly protein PilF
VNEGDATAALQYLSEAEKLGPKLPELHHVRSLAYSLRKDLTMALSEARLAHGGAPSDSAIATTLGKLLMEAGLKSEAERVLTPAANDPLYGDSYRARTNLAIIHLERGNRGAAREQLDRAINEAPGRACHAHYFRSQMLQDQGLVREALRDLEAATQKLCASFAEAHLAIGIALTRDRQYARARRKFLEVSQRFPGTDFADRAIDNLRYLP